MNINIVLKAILLFSSLSPTPQSLFLVGQTARQPPNLCLWADLCTCNGVMVEHSWTNDPQSLWWDCHLQSPNPQLLGVKNFCMVRAMAEPLEQMFCRSALDCRLRAPRAPGNGR